jgi:hypothetical protein
MSCQSPVNVRHTEWGHAHKGRLWGYGPRLIYDFTAMQGAWAEVPLRLKEQHICTPCSRFISLVMHLWACNGIRFSWCAHEGYKLNRLNNLADLARSNMMTRDPVMSVLPMNEW